MKLLPYIITIIALVSCGPAAKLRKAERLITQAEELGAKWRVDTVEKLVEIPIREVWEKNIYAAPIHDTIVMEKERLKVKVVRLPGDSVYVEGKCAADTIIKKVPVTVTKTIEAKSNFPWWWLIIAVLVGAGLVAIFKK
jgi:hypothetical protein